MSSRNRYQCRLSLQITSPLTHILPNATDPMHSTNLPIIDQSEAVALLKGQVPFRPRVIVIKGPQRTFTTCEKGKQLLSSNSHGCTCFCMCLLAWLWLLTDIVDPVNTVSTSVDTVKNGIWRHRLKLCLNIIDTNYNAMISSSPCSIVNDNIVVSVDDISKSLLRLSEMTTQRCQRCH